MKNKVEICGINTSTLPKLSSADTEKMLMDLKNGDLSKRESLIVGNMRLVLSVLHRYVPRVGNLDDIFQIGCVGLVKAIDNFDVTLDVRFSTYAVPMIVGEIRRCLREANGIRVSRGIRDVAYLALTARERLKAEGEEDVGLDKIAERLNMPISKVAFCLDSINEPISLNEPAFSDGEDTTLLMDQISDKTNTEEKWIDNVSLADAISRLEERERKILKKRYFEGKTQTEVSVEIGISQAQVSRLEKNAIGSIRAYFS